MIFLSGGGSSGERYSAVFMTKKSSPWYGYHIHTTNDKGNKDKPKATNFIEFGKLVRPG